MGNTVSRFNQLRDPQGLVLLASTSYLVYLLNATESKRLKNLRFNVLLSAFLCIQYDLPWSHLPWTVYIVFFSGKGLEKNLKRVIARFVVGTVWTGYVLWLTKVLSLCQLEMRHGWWLPYIGFIKILGFKRLSSVPTLLHKLMIRYLWDPPLLISIHLSKPFGIHVLNDGKGKFISIIDENIAISSMPTYWDIPKLRSAEMNILSVVNMQNEWQGPINAYQKAGIEQLRLRTLDTFAPTLEDLRRGVAFIKRRLKECPGSRVLIHCKAGRGRAITMAISYYLSIGVEPNIAFKRIKLVRHVAIKHVLQYPVIKKFAEECNNF